MNLYPDGHPPFEPRGVTLDDLTGAEIQAIDCEHSLENCLHGASWTICDVRRDLERLRAQIFRAEQLIMQQPLPAKDLWVLMPDDIPALVETLKAAQTCLEEWLESERVFKKMSDEPGDEP